MRPAVKRLLVVVILITAVIAYGTLGFLLIEGLSLIDSLYMTVITISTVGFGLLKPLSTLGKLFVVTLILGGVGIVAIGVSTLFQFILEDLLNEYFFRRRRMQKVIEKLQRHYIIAGYGRVGAQVAIEFAKAKKTFVVIENDSERISELLNVGVLFIEGDATDDDVLLKAGVDRAKGLIAALNTDADNVFITLSARGLNKDILLIARANTPEAEAKLKAAGANKVISPYLIGARRMAAMLLKPVVSDYLDLVTHGEMIEYRLEELAIKEGSTLHNLSIEDAHIRQKTGALVLAVKRKEKLNTNPTPDYILKTGDRLVAIGTSNQLESLEKLL